MLALLLSLVVQAQEIKVPVIEGDHQVSKQYEILSHMRWERVSSLTVEGKKRLEELQADGYTCMAGPSSTYNCTKHMKDLKPFEQLDQALQARWKHNTFSFYPAFGEPSLVNNTEFFKEYSVSQKVVLWEVPYQKEVFTWNPVSYNWTHAAWKIYLGNAAVPSSKYVPFLIEDTGLYVTEIVDFEKGWIRDRYFVKIKLEKVGNE